MTIEIYTDGSCLRNPGPGGYGAVVFCKQNLTVVSGFIPETTNNQMELLAVIKSLEYIKNSKINKVPIVIHTDSQYVKNGIELWIVNWQKNGWKTATKQPVKNQELWKRLYDLNHDIKPEWRWVKGHSDNEYNSMVDFVANSTARNSRIFHEEDITSFRKKFPEVSEYSINLGI